jgi:hypothetical protein
VFQFEKASQPSCSNITCPSKDEAGLVQPDWEASIVAGAFRDLAHAASLPDVLGYSVQLVFPNGLASALDSTPDESNAKER